MGASGRASTAVLAPVLTLRGRAFIYLELTADMEQLGIDDDAIFELVRDPAILGEIQRLREIEGCN